MTGGMDPSTRSKQPRKFSTAPKSTLRWGIRKTLLRRTSVTLLPLVTHRRGESERIQDKHANESDQKRNDEEGDRKPVHLHGSDFKESCGPAWNGSISHPYLGKFQILQFASVQ